MCDTLVALPPATARGATLFAKNSDRERNEAQALEFVAAARHPDGARLGATYIEIPQVPFTHACLLSRPFWMWGAEMGANACGVVIGNEAVHARVPAPRRRALIGMDLVRLGLERAASAEEAVAVITHLLEAHGQGGDCGHLGRFYYHNSFLIADRTRAFVLETVGRWWALEEVVAARSISNALSIGRSPDAIGGGLAAHAREEGWTDAEGRFDFAGRLMDPERDRISRGVERCARSSALMAARGPRLIGADMMAILRDHGEAGADAGWSPSAIRGRTLCMHAGPADRRGQTTAAMVSELGPGRDIHWVTATAAPCLGLFRPVLLEAGPPDVGPAPTDKADARSLWWAHERLHRAVLEDYAPRLARFAADRDALEASFAERIADAVRRDVPPDALRSAVSACWREAADALERWTRAVTAAPRPTSPENAYRRSWRRLNHLAGLQPFSAGP